MTRTPFLFEGGPAGEPVPLADRLPRSGTASPPTWLEPAPAATWPLFLAVATPAAPAAGPSAEAIRELEDTRRAAAEEAQRAAHEKVEVILHRYADAIERLGRSRPRTAPVAGEVVELALIVARELLRRELSVDPAPLLATLEEALASVEEEAPVIIRIGRADHEWIRGQRPELLTGGDLVVIEDDKLQRGGCVIESRLRVVDATIERRLDAVRGALTELLTAPAPAPASAPKEAA